MPWKPIWVFAEKARADVSNGKSHEFPERRTFPSARRARRTSATDSSAESSLPAALRVLRGETASGNDRPAFAHFSGTTPVAAAAANTLCDFAVAGFSQARAAAVWVEQCGTDSADRDPR